MSGSKHREQLWGFGIITPGKNLEIVIAKSCSVVHVGVLTQFNNGNAVLAAVQQWEWLSLAFPLEMTRTRARARAHTHAHRRHYRFCCSPTWLLLFNSVAMNSQPVFSPIPTPPPVPPICFTQSPTATPSSLCIALLLC